MPGIGSTDWSALSPANSTLTEGNYTLLASICLFYYDYIITVAAEVRICRRCSLNLATWFYFLIRYGFLVDITLVAIFSVRLTQDSGPPITVRECELFYSFAALMNLFNFAAVSAFIAMRICAIWGRNWAIAIFLFCLGIVNPNVISVLFVMRLRMVLAPWPIWGCEAYIPDADEQTVALITQRLPIISSAVSIFYELLCLSLTAWKTCSMYHSQRRSGGHATLARLLLRDGSVYFLVMTVLSTVNIVAALIPGAPSNISVNTVFGRALTPILTTRFIAHLPQASREDDDTSLAISRGTLHSQSRLFTSIGPIMSYTDCEDEYESDAPARGAGNDAESRQ